MNNLRDLQVQARSLESAGQHAAALKLYERILEEPAGQRDGGVWVRKARLHLALSQQTEAAESYATAAERYQSMGLANLALAQSQRAEQVDSSRPEGFLRSARLAASLGYARDARSSFLAYADRAIATNEEAAAVAALRECLSFFPEDEAVRARLVELAGEAPPYPPVSLPEVSVRERIAPTETEAGPAAVLEADPDVGAAPAEVDEVGVEELVETSAGAPDAAPQVEPLEGFEPTRVEGPFDASPEVELESDAAEGASDPAVFASLDLEGGEVSEEEEPDAAEVEPLPLLGVEPGTVAPTPAEEIAAARARVADNPGDLTARRELIALLRAHGAPELAEALADAERHFAEAGRMAEALRFVEELARLEPRDTALQQRRVERALRAGDRQALLDAYLALADALEAERRVDAARDALRRVLELEPDNERARAVVGAPTSLSPAREYVDLGELILSGVQQEATRFQVAALEPTGDEESDFEEILNLFRQKIARSLDPKDSASHYDLGLAFKEMGLLDDAIIHLQSGLRGGANPLATLEVLGECFVLKGQTSLAARVFERATRLEGVGESDLVGVLYGLARCQEELGQREQARGTYERIVAVDLSFRDAAQRLERLQSR